MNTTKTRLQKDQLAFLADMMAYYTIENLGIVRDRSRNLITCSYSAGCAIGRHVPDKNLCMEFDTSIDCEFSVCSDGMDACRKIAHLFNLL